MYLQLGGVHWIIRTMGESLNTPRQISVGYGRINATWMNGTAIWLSDYYPRREPEIEALQLARREEKLVHAFKRYKLLDPTIEILKDEASDLGPESKSAASKIGGQLLRVTTLLMPYVDPAHIRPIVELRQQAPTEQQVHEELVVGKLRAGGQAIYDYFGSAMTESNSRR